MYRLVKMAACMVLAGFVGSAVALGEKAANGVPPVPTHADAAVIVAKFYGLFDRYVDQGADLNECVAFLNKHGVYFGLLEVANGAEFTKKDCARVMGQINLLFSGEAEFLHGKVAKPIKVGSWVEYCVLNDVPYETTYRSICEFLRRAVQAQSE